MSLYVYLGNTVMLQLEAFLCKLLLPLAEGKGSPGVGRQEAALEVRPLAWLSRRQMSASSDMLANTLAIFLCPLCNWLGSKLLNLSKGST